MPLSIRHLPTGPTPDDVDANPDLYPAEVEAILKVPQTFLAPVLASIDALVQQVFEPLVGSINALVQQTLEPYFGEGTVLNDLRRARHGDVEALARLAARFPWAPHRTSPAWRELAKRAGAEGWEVARRNALMVALFEVLQRQNQPRPIRLGRQYVIADDESLLRPTELPIDLYYRWLRRETIKAMEAHLTDEPYPSSQPPFPTLPLDAAESLPDSVTPEDILLAQEREAEHAQLIAMIRNIASPRTRQVIDYALENRIDWAEAAREIGLEPSTARVMMYRLRRRLGLL